MQHSINSIRTFIGAKDYSISRQFYKDLGFEELVLSPKMCYFKADNFGFYLQDYYIKDWIDNSMVFVENEFPVGLFGEQIKINFNCSSCNIGDTFSVSI